MRPPYPDCDHVFIILVEFEAAANQSQTYLQISEICGLLSQWKLSELSETMPSANP